MADISQVKLPNGDTYNLVDETSGYIKNYTETDPVFNASAASGITATDISNWNGKAAGDHQHGYISNEGSITTYGSITSGSRLIFAKSNTWKVTMAPASMAFGSDSTKYLANDGTWQSIPDTSNFLTLATLPIYDGTVV